MSRLQCFQLVVYIHTQHPKIATHLHTQKQPNHNNNSNNNNNINNNSNNNNSNNNSNNIALKGLFFEGLSLLVCLKGTPFKMLSFKRLSLKDSL